MTTIVHALIRTHHITSSKKIACLKAAAEKYDVHVLIRSGAPPGIMYVEGRDEMGGSREMMKGEERVRMWLEIVRVCRKFRLDFGDAFAWSFFFENIRQCEYYVEHTCLRYLAGYLFSETWKKAEHVESYLRNHNSVLITYLIPLFFKKANNIQVQHSLISLLVPSLASQLPPKP